MGAQSPRRMRRPCTALFGSGAARTAETGHYLHLAKDGSKYRAPVRVGATAGLASHAGLSPASLLACGQSQAP